MPGWEMKIIEAEARRLLPLAAEDADLRADLRALALAILAATEAPQTGAADRSRRPQCLRLPGRPEPVGNPIRRTTAPPRSTKPRSPSRSTN